MGVARGKKGGCFCGRIIGTFGSTESEIDLNSIPLSHGSNRGSDELVTNRKGFPIESRTAKKSVGGKKLSPAEELGGWLASLGLSAYEGTLISQGFDSLEAMSTVTESDLETMGFKKGHLRLLMARASSASQMSSGGNFRGGVSVTNGLASAFSPAAATATSRPSGVIPPVTGKQHNDSLQHAASWGNGAAAGNQSWSINTQGEEGNGREVGVVDEAEKRPYCDPQYLRPLRSVCIEDESRSDAVGSGGLSGREGFKELSPKEMELAEVIGEGSFGVVRRGRWRGMDVAVKELKVSIAFVASNSCNSVDSDDSVMTNPTEVAEGAGAATSAGFKPRDNQRKPCVNGEEEMRHEARMLAKVCNHVQ